TLLVTGCGGGVDAPIAPVTQELTHKVPQKTFTYEVKPETFEIFLTDQDERLAVSQPSERRLVTELEEREDGMSWYYPEEAISVVLRQASGYLEVVISSEGEGDTSFAWPQVAGESYTLPLREGKLIPSTDRYWQEYLTGESLAMIESLSMRFFGVNHGTRSLLYIMDDLYHSDMQFEVVGGALEATVAHDYEVRNEDKSYSFRIYVTDNNPVEMARIYKDYLLEKGEWTSLEDKAKKNPEIKKLYGASHVYLWDQYALSEENIDWKALREAVDAPIVEAIKGLLYQVDGGIEVIDALEAMGTQDYVDQYQKNLICKGFTDVMALDAFCELAIFGGQSGAERNEAERFAAHKELLRESLPKVFDPVDDWADSRGVAILQEMKAGGLDRLWVGLDNWRQGVMKPELVEKAVAKGYLIGPYDSYHSIHKPGEEQWHTAAFTDRTLYEEATILKKDGSYEKGFQGVGRKLNPTLAKDAVKERMKQLEATGVPFNSWFIDCDATGEIYDDYSEVHPTTAQQDVAARLWRMDYIADEYNKVVGSEGGNDFASETIAFAHGIELPSFSWMDEEMKSIKDSPYYMGRYYNPKGGVPERFAKPIPIKDTYKRLFVDQCYNLPLFKLVYNDALITTYHWDWSTFKMADEVANRMLYEILYNVPPLYHLDKWEWEKYKDQILSHSQFYETFSEQAILVPMTDFEVLTEDRMVQTTSYGEELKVVANFGNAPYLYEERLIEGQSLIVINKGAVTHYKP
ncbi:MAG: glycoside hydrolase, partial [Cellulosilyticaceae bacterium]